MTNEEALDRAAEWIADAEALVIGAGAGMGVDSGLPDFRGPQGFWRAYPPYAEKKLVFTDLANPRWFHEDPEFAWGFYGHRLDLYRRTAPHAGYELLRAWGRALKHGCFVFTSNVDGQFQAAGFAESEIVEAHGSIHWLQPLRATGELFPADEVAVSVDTDTMRALPPLPHHPKRDEILRPNILMFGDGGWDSQRAQEQEHRFERWLEELRGDRLVVVECGAGSAVPTVRWQSEQLVSMLGGALVRINTREPDVPARPGRQIGTAAAGGDGIGISLGALEALRAIAARLPRGDTGPSA